MNKKAILRSEIQKTLSGLPPDYKKNADQKIYKRVITLPEVVRSKTICCYSSFRTEVDTKQIIHRLHLMGKTVIPPESPKAKLVNCYLLPGIAFDRTGHRLGRGRGFYDKLLVNVTVPKIALAYAVQIIAEVPVTGYDVSVTAIITDKEIIRSNAL